MSTSPSYPLNQPLPPMLAAAGHLRAGSFRRYPVFSWPWLWRRTRAFVLAILGLSSLLVIGRGISDGYWLYRISIAIWPALGFSLIATLGPALATLVRNARLSPRYEAIGVVLAILLGACASYPIDVYTSMKVSQAIGEAATAATQATRPTHLIALNVLWLALIYLLLGGGLALRAYFGERRRWLHWQHEREMESLRDARRDSERRLGVLQAQIEPHFLFNTLASIRSLVGSEPRRAEAAIDALVAYLRASIPRLSGRDTTIEATLARQFDICERYLQVMQVRMGDRLDYRIDLPEALRHHPFPPLLLISLVENAIKHGLEPRAGAGRVVLRADVGQGADGKTELLVSVEDDGAGLAAVPGRGIGLTNVREQLAAQFAGDAGLSIDGRPGGGVRAVIRIPFEGDG